MPQDVALLGRFPIIQQNKLLQFSIEAALF